MSDDDVTASSSLTPVWTTFRVIFRPTEMGRTVASGAGSAKYAYMVYKVAVHGYSAFLMLIFGNMRYWTMHVCPSDSRMLSVSLYAPGASSRVSGVTLVV